MEECEVVDKSDIPLGAQHFPAVVIESVQIDIGEELAGEVADRDAASSLERRKQVIAGIIKVDRLLRVGRINDYVNQIQGPLAGDPPSDVTLQDLVIDRRKIPEDVTAQHVAEPVAILLIAYYRPMCSLSLAIGIGVENESALEQRSAHRVYCMVDNAVAERGGGYDPMLRIEHLDLPVASGQVGPIPEFPLQPQSLELLTGEKRRHIATRAFSFRGLARCFQQGFERSDPVEEITLFHGCGEPFSRHRSGARCRQSSASRTHGDACRDIPGHGRAATGSAASRY